MVSKNQIKQIQSLKQKKFREETGLFVAEGTKIVSELLHSSIQVETLYATAEFLSGRSIPDTFPVVEISRAELERISFLTAPNEVLAVCRIPEPRLDSLQLKGKLILMLDDIRDPGNLGTILRIADWFGIEQVICSIETADAFNPKVVQATMGSIARVQVHYLDLDEYLKSNHSSEMPVFGALLDGDNVYSQKLPAEGFLMIGNESHGISIDLQKHITHRLRIPSFGKLKSNGGEAESLNAAIATAILCSEFRRNY